MEFFIEKWAMQVWKSGKGHMMEVKGINTWVVPLVRDSGPFLKWTREELKQIDQRTRKRMTMHKALHLSDDVVRLYVSRRDEGY